MVSCVREKCIYQWKTLQNSLDYILENTSKQNTNCFGNRSSIIYGCGHSGTDA